MAPQGLCWLYADRMTTSVEASGVTLSLWDQAFDSLDSDQKSLELDEDTQA